MATGDPANILARLKSLLPARWFSDAAPVRDAVLGGPADGLAAAHALIAYAAAQTRIATAAGFWLDLIAFDFFALRFRRRKGQGDDSFRAAVSKEIFRVRATRPGMAQAIEDLTGVKPIIFEPANPHDTGAYGAPTMGWSTAGRYGSIALVNEVYMDVCRPLGQGVPLIAGWGSAGMGYATSIDVVDPVLREDGTPVLQEDGTPLLREDSILSSDPRGRGEWTGQAQVEGPVTDLDIYRTVEAVRPVGVTVWTRISDALPPDDLQPSYKTLLTPDEDALVMPDGSRIYVSGPT